MNLAQSSSITEVSDHWPALTEWVQALTFQAGYNTSLVVVGTTLLGISAGVVGVFALLRKRSLVSDALSHATLPGIGLAFLAASALGLEGRSLPVLLVGAGVSGVAGIISLQAILKHTRLAEDAAIGVVLSVFFGAGIVLLSYIQKNATGAAGLNQLIYGQTAAMRFPDVVLMASIAALTILAALLLTKEFTIVCFNDAFAQVEGWPVVRIDLLMMALLVMVTIAGLQAVGIILVVALLIVPPVSARFWTERLGRMIVIAALFGALSGYFGSVISSLFPRKPAGAVIVLTSGFFFAVSLVFAPTRGVIANVSRRVSLRLRIAEEHLLEVGYESRLAQGEAVVSSPKLAELARVRGWPSWFRRALLWRLARRGLIRREPHQLRLTEAGERRGARVCRNHQLWEQYLVSYADLAPSHVDWSVDQVEHVLSEDLVQELESALARKGISIPTIPGEER